MDTFRNRADGCWQCIIVSLFPKSANQALFGLFVEQISLMGREQSYLAGACSVSAHNYEFKNEHQRDCSSHC